MPSGQKGYSLRHDGPAAVFDTLRAEPPTWVKDPALWLLAQQLRERHRPMKAQCQRCRWCLANWPCEAERHADHAVEMSAWPPEERSAEVKAGFAANLLRFGAWG